MILKIVISLILFITGLIIFMQAESSPLPFGIGDIKSDSMAPNLHKGDFIFWRKKDSYGENSRIIFKSPQDQNQLIAHRVSGFFVDGQTYYTTKGDANSDLDPWQVRSDLVLGEIVWKIPWLGYVSSFFSNSIVVICTVLIPALILIAEEVFFIYSNSNVRIKSLIKH